MPKILSKEQIEQYQETGYVSPIEVMSEDEAAGYKEKLEAAERDYPEHIHAAKSKGFVSWHQDATYMGMSKNTFLSPWIALSPSNLETGCMSMIPGSHKQHIVDHEDTFGADNILTRGQRVNDVDETKAEHLILRPGQMSVHHCEVIHGSQPNLSDQRRIGFALQSYMQNNVIQEIAENQWMHCRGERRNTPDHKELRRPKFDLDPEAMADREAASENYANILYHGATQKRSY